MRTPCFAIFVGALALGCASNGMHPLPGAQPSPRVLGATDLGSVGPDRVFDLVVGVALQNANRLPIVQEQLTADGDALSPEDFADRFAVSPAAYFRVTSFLRSAGFQIVRTTPGRTTVTVRGNVDTIHRAFGVDLHEYVDGLGVFTAAPTAISVSNEVYGTISGVVGLNDVRWASHLSFPDGAAFPNAGTGSQTPADLQSRYDEVITAGSTPGMGQTVAILSTNSATKTTDLNAYLTKYKPAGVSTLAMGQYTQAAVGGPLRDAPDSNAYVENVLDAEMVLAMAPFATIVQVFTATNGAGLFTDGIAYIVNNVSQAHVVTVSWGTCERGAQGEMPVLNALFAQARAEGQQWFFAAGDTGSDGCRDGSGNTIMSAGWPASSPHVVGVGGTQVLDATTEVLWDGSGGGVSESFDKPAYQTGATPNDASRDEPDVAAMAGGSGVSIVANGKTGGVLGTSAATPIWAGVYAVLLQQKAPAGKGFTNALEQFYTLGKASQGFTDIKPDQNGTTQLGPGQNAGGGYPAEVGYDLVTGWGTPDLKSLIANWK